MQELLFRIDNNNPTIFYLKIQLLKISLKLCKLDLNRVY